MKQTYVRRTAVAGPGLLLLGGMLVVAPPAWAAPPSNDNRANATTVTPPQTLNGTLVDATLEPATDFSNCVDTDASVWYRFTAPERGAIVIQMDAAGDMDGAVDLFRQVRSRLDWVDCSATDSRGTGTIDNDTLEPGGTYAIRVSRQFGSVADTFALRVLIPQPPAEPPGQRLPRKGVQNQVDRLLNPDDAYRTRMRAGRTMRLSLRTDQCTSLEVHGPGTRSFTDEAVRTLRCGGYGLFTPTETGRHFLVVSAGRSRDQQPYRLRVAPARRDDTTPGVFIGNHRKVKGRVNGGIDSRDLYRFDVVRRSALTLRLTGEPQMTLVRDEGTRLGRGNLIDRNVPAGRYFVAVEGTGKYALRRVSRTITHASLHFNGRSRAKIAPTDSARLTLRVRPAVTGPSRMSVERFDPIEGWQFLRNYRARVTRGKATVIFRPPSVGRYRASGAFKGTRRAAPDETGIARLRVQGRLVQ